MRLPTKSFFISSPFFKDIIAILTRVCPEKMGDSPLFSIMEILGNQESTFGGGEFLVYYPTSRSQRRYPMKKLTVLALTAATLLALSGCATKTQTGALTGAAVGGIGGAMLGNSKTAAVGAAAGAVTGAIIGKQLEN
jgi:hypothetical protein